jgi:Flp pilus assembly protein TadD
LFRQGDLGGAIRELREALRIAPTHASAARWHYNLAAMLNAAGQPDDAVRELRQALRIDPGYVAAQRALNGMLNGVK